MTKEEYLEIREREEIPLSLFYEYYKEKGGVLDQRRFELTFPQWLYANQDRPIIFNNQLVGIVDFSNIISLVYSYFNRTFEV